MNQIKKKRKTSIRILRIAAKTILYTILVFLVCLLLIQTGPVQNFIRKKAVVYLQDKLDTRVAIGKIYVGFPKDIILEDIYIEDRQKDTLLSGGLVKANLDIWDLAINSEINIQSITLEDITAKITRQGTDSFFNYQFIVDAFVPVDTTTSTDTTSSALALGDISLENVRLVYKDVVTGNDVEAWIGDLDSKVDNFDPQQLSFDIPHTRIDGLNARVYQTKPLASPEPEIVDSLEALEPIAFQLNFKELDLKNINIDYRNDVSAMYANVDLGKLLIKPENIDMQQRIIKLGDISLENTTAMIRLGKTPGATIVAREVEQEVTSQANAGWKFQVSSIDLKNNNIRFDNDNGPTITRGMDYGHLNLEDFTLEAKDIFFSSDSIGGSINNASFREGSGFVLNELRTDFLYAGTQAFLKNLYLETPGTTLKRDLMISYPSIGALTSDIGTMEMDLDIEDSKILVKDILTFVPDLANQPAFADANATWYINSRITGRVNDLEIASLQISGLSDTRIDIAGNIGGLPNMDNMHADLAIREFRSSRRDINRFLPPNTVPANITLPSVFNVSGRLNGSAGSINTALQVNTDLGNASINGNFRDIADMQRAQYDATIAAKGLNIGAIIQNSEFRGPVTATITAKGSGIDPKTANAVFSGTVHSAIIKNYTYRDLKINGTLANQQAEITAGIVDPNIHFNINANADLSKEFPAVVMTGMVDSIKLHALNFSSDRMIFRGKIDANFPVTDPDNLQGELFLTQALFIQNETRLPLDTVSLLAGKTDTGQFIRLNSDVVYANLEGEFKITELGKIFQQAVQPYFAVVPGDTIVTREPYDFTLNAYILDNPALKVFLPQLQRIDSVNFTSHFSSTGGWTALLNAPSVDMGTNKIRNLKLSAGTGQNDIDVVLSMEQLTSGKDIRIDNTTIIANLANNQINFTLNSKDRSFRDKYIVKGLLSQPESGDYQLSLLADSLMLNYDAWSVTPNNSISFGKNGIMANELVLSQGNQQLRLNSLSTNPNAPLETSFTDFQLGTLAGFVQTDSTFANGTINGKITFTDLAREPVFVGDINVTDFSFKGDTVGNVRLLVNNNTPDVYNADLTLSGRGNDVKLDGNYYLNSTTSNFDFDLDIRTMPMATLEALSDGAITGSAGSVNGKFDLKGTVAKPLVNGDLNFNQAGFNLGMLNSWFRIDNEKLRIDEKGIHFDRFEIRDSSNNPLVINGLAATSNFVNYEFDMTVRANNFKALNSTKKNNDIFYGLLYFNTNLNIKGTESAPVVDGRLVINDSTKLTIVLPQSEPGVVDREGVVEFVDMDAPFNDSLFLAAYDSLNTSEFRGMDIAVNIEIVPEAEFNLVIDEGNGDFLKVKGEALLTGGIDPSGKVNLSGSYELEQGSYELTFNFLKRKFDIQKGSRIIWEGEPTAATLDVQAVYVANTAPLDLVKNQLESATAAERNTYLQKLPFDVYLKMEGPLMKPEISFDIVLPEEKKYAVSGDILTNVRTRLDQLRQEPGEMNKQVFSLLLLNRFIDENPFNSSSGGPNAGALARQSVSKLLTEQLNRLAGDLVGGVGLNFDVVSSEDYTTGERRDRTDLNVGLSKKLLNDRLTVSVGSNFELEGPQQSNQQGSNIAGNIAVDYQLSRDNRYLLRAYRKNEYEGVIDGYIIETGIGFVITMDYNRFSELFMSSSARKDRRARRKQQREVNIEQKNPVDTTTENK